MIDVVAISLENEMDLVLAHKRSMKFADKLGLSVATQTTFATAVSEIARTVIEHTNNGNLKLGLEQQEQRYSLTGLVSFDSGITFTNADQGYYYAQKLVPEFETGENENLNFIKMKIGLPKSLRLDSMKIAAIKSSFLHEPPLNAYEEIKQRNNSLSLQAQQNEEELRRSRIIDEQKTEFISIASHEIKTPITIIKAYTQMVSKMSTDQCSGMVKGIIEKLDQQSTKLMALVQQLMDVSKMENGSLVYSTEVVDLNTFVTEMVDMMAHILPNNTLTVNLGKSTPVKIDPLRMEQVFSNLLGNAAKYSGSNTSVTIGSMIVDDFVQISIADEGMGMSPNSVKSIFQKFYRDQDVLRSHSGLGMGLYICSKIITENGGQIWVESTQGVGSNFYFTIPIHNKG